jgi:transcriptional regulator with XRE-family HTH domain
MEQDTALAPGIDLRIAARLRELRSARGWPLDELARRSGVSRATLSRLENAEVSATATALGKLCAAYGLTVSRLMVMAEGAFAPRVPRGDQLLWRDPETGFERRSVSPPAGGLAGEVVECRLPPGVSISYERPPRAGLEHHLVMKEGALELTVEGHRHALEAGDCLRYQLFGASRFETRAETGAHYLLFIV